MMSLDQMTDAELIARSTELLAEIRDGIERLRDAYESLAYQCHSTSLGMEAADQLRILQGGRPRLHGDRISADQMDAAAKWLEEELRGREEDRLHLAKAVVR